MTLLLDLCELGIAVHGTDALPSQPGYAFLPDSGGIALGLEAIQQAKLHPTRINDRFWSELTTEPNGFAHPQVRHNADLAWHQLKSVVNDFRSEPLICCVPSSYTSETLELLAGICHSLDIRPLAFANRALMASRGREHKHSVHVEMQQHQTLLTHIETSDQTTTKVSYERLPGLGLARLFDRWMHLIRQRFISSSRFDPLHSGDTEQQLFSQLYNNYRDRSPQDLYRFKVFHADQEQIQEFSPEDLASPYLEMISEIREKAGDFPLILDQHFSGLPGFRHANDMEIADTNTIVENIERIASGLPLNTEHVPYIDSILLQTAAPLTQAKPTTPNRSPASHLVCAGYAYPASNYQIDRMTDQLTLIDCDQPKACHVIYESGGLKAGENCGDLRVNNTVVHPGTLLSPGDNLSFDGTTASITVIAMHQGKAQ